MDFLAQGAGTGRGQPTATKRWLCNHRHVFVAEPHKETACDRLEPAIREGAPCVATACQT